MAAGTCLGLVAQATKDEILPEIIPFIEQNISSPDWRLREAATLAFGSILEGPKMVQALVIQAFGLLLKHMSDPVPQVKDTATWTVGRICELHPRTLDDKLQTVFQALVEKLMDVPGVAANACWAIHNLAEAYEEQSIHQTSPISPFFGGTVEVLLQTSERSDASERKLRSSAYEAINLMIQAAPLDRNPMIMMLIPVFIERLEKTYAMPILNVDDRAEQTEKQALLCGSLQTIIQKLGEAVKPKADDLMTAFLKVFNFKTASVHEEALMAVGALANAVDLDFEKYMQHFRPQLLTGLQNSEEHMVCAIAVGVVGDICRALGDRIFPYCDEIIHVLLQNLQNPALHRNVKPPILSCFGDIALAIGGNFEKYLAAVMSILQQASATQVDPNDYDLVEYLNLLRDGILEAYTGIFQGFRSDKKAQLLERYVESILQFVEVVWKDVNTSEQVHKGLVGLIGDIAHALGPAVKPVLQRPAISNLLSSSLKHENPQIKDLAKWATQVITNPGA
eukprot:TRINITY_DN3234_c0_g1_i4.p1 TRINITY_DN3234_c0_g1~~TRINITY_DN3234_c0_g1_i4.p1  ORF type:complete len:508 (+),score=118.61 TRINITY_DN3234_c0_g1_i4:1129-2652(+)